MIKLSYERKRNEKYHFVFVHLKNIYESGELTEKATTKESLVVQKEGNRSVRREIQAYNLDVIISVGYRVNSIRGTQFRIWATNNKDVETTKTFFAAVQNKIHFAVHGHTATEIVAARADAGKKYMGLTNFRGKAVLEKDVSVAKNYLSEEELKQLNLIVTLYLDFAELQASNRRAMTMKEWVAKLEDAIYISDFDRQTKKYSGGKKE